MDRPSTDPTLLARPDDLTGTTIGRFQITALLGKGGMGEVYLAEDSLLKRSVAMKRVSAALRSDPQYRALLIKEAERASRLNDERVAHVHDVLEHGGEIFLIMEYVEGKSLRERIGPPMPLDEFFPIALQCVEALMAADQSEIIHRDIKPENIMVTPKGRVKICDFGLARNADWAESATTILEGRLPAIVGTPAYMAPEALLNRNVDGRADVFSLGIVFYELLAGGHPFREENNVMATADRIIHSPHTPAMQINAAIPKTLSGILDRMLRKEPADRYTSPAELLLDLESARDAAPASTKLRKSNFAAAGILLSLMLTAAAGSFWLGDGRAPLKPAEQRNLVVLPFRAIGDSADGQFYSDGLTETLTARLSRLADASDLLVTPASEVRAKRVTTAQEARRQFEADVILAGTLHQSDSGLRLIYSLYDATTLRQLRADTIVTSASNPFLLEDRLLNDVISALGVSKAPALAASSGSRTSVPEAYELYVQGRGYLQDSADADRLQVAVLAFEQARKLDPGYATAYASLGEAYWAKYQATREAVWVGLAREACEKADQLDPKSAEARICLGNVNFGSGQFERSIRDFESAVELDSSNDAAYLGLAGAYERTGNHEAAERTYRKAIELKPNYYLSHTRLGQYYVRRGRYADAAAQFQEEISLVPNGEQAYLRIGAAYIYLNRYEDAITVLRKSIELRPTAGALSNLGAAYLRLRRFDDAIPPLEQAVKLVPRYHIHAGNLARAYYWSMNQRLQADAMHERAVQLAQDELVVNARNSDAHIMLARYYAMLGRKTEALNHLTTALTLRPNDAEYHSIAGVVHNQLGNRRGALAALRKALSTGWSITSIESEIEFDNLRTDPEFQKLTEG